MPQMPLALVDVRREQRRIAALLQRNDVTVHVPKPRRKPWRDQPYFCLCSKLDPEGLHRNPALDYLRQGLEQARAMGGRLRVAMEGAPPPRGDRADRGDSTESGEPRRTEPRPGSAVEVGRRETEGKECRRGKNRLTQSHDDRSLPSKDDIEKMSYAEFKRHDRDRKRERDIQRSHPRSLPPLSRDNTTHSGKMFVPDNTPTGSFIKTASRVRGDGSLLPMIREGKSRGQAATKRVPTEPTTETTPVRVSLRYKTKQSIHSDMAESDSVRSGQDSAIDTDRYHCDICTCASPLLLENSDVTHTRRSVGSYDSGVGASDGGSARTCLESLQHGGAHKTSCTSFRSAYMTSSGIPVRLCGRCRRAVVDGAYMQDAIKSDDKPHTSVGFAPLQVKESVSDLSSVDSSVLALRESSWYRKGGKEGSFGVGRRKLPQVPEGAPRGRSEFTLEPEVTQLSGKDVPHTEHSFFRSRTHGIDVDSLGGNESSDSGDYVRVSDGYDTSRENTITKPKTTEVAREPKQKRSKKKKVRVIERQDSELPERPPTGNVETYMAALDNLDKRIDDGAFDFSTNLNVNDVDTQLHLPQGEPQESGEKTRVPRGRIVGMEDVFRDADRQAYIKALAAAQMNRLPSEPWMYFERISRRTFSYFEPSPIKRNCPDCDKPILEAPERALPPSESKGKKKKVNEMKHIFGNIDINDYYPGGRCNPIIQRRE